MGKQVADLGKKVQEAADEAQADVAALQAAAATNIKKQEEYSAKVLAQVQQFKDEAAKVSAEAAAAAKNIGNQVAKDEAEDAAKVEAEKAEAEKPSEEAPAGEAPAK